MSGTVDGSRPLVIAGDTDAPSCDGGVCAVPEADTDDAVGSPTS